MGPFREIGLEDKMSKTNLEPSLADEAATEDITNADPTKDQQEDWFWRKMRFKVTRCFNVKWFDCQ